MASKTPRENNVLFVVQNSPQGNDDNEQTKAGVYFGRKMWQIKLPPYDGPEGPWVSFPAPYWYTYGGDGSDGGSVKKDQSPYQLWYCSIDGKSLPNTSPLSQGELKKMLGIPDLDPTDPDQAAKMNAALRNPKLVYPVDLSGHLDGFDNLVLTYPFPEGGPNLSIAAMVRNKDGGPDLVLGPFTSTLSLPPGNGSLPHVPSGQGGLPNQGNTEPNLPHGGAGESPAPKPIDGTDASCPIQFAYGYVATEEDGGPKHKPDDAIDYPLSNLVWDSGATARYNTPEHGGWTTTIVWGDAPDGTTVTYSFIDMIAKRNLKIGNPPQWYHFDHWEWQSKLELFGAPDPSDDYYYPLDANTFSGLIAYYEPGFQAGGDLGDWKTKGDGKDHDDPVTPAGFLTLVAHQVSYDLSLLARGVLDLFRHAPGTAGHGEKLTAPSVDDATRSRIAALAQRYPNDEGELQRVLDTLHR